MRFLNTLYGGYEYHFINRHIEPFVNPPEGYARVDGMHGRRVLVEVARRCGRVVEEWLGQDPMEREPWLEYEDTLADLYRYLSTGGPHGLDPFDGPMSFLECYRREVYYPPPTMVVPVTTLAPEPSEWIEVAFVDPDGEPIEVGIELELPSGRVMRANNHTLRTTDHGGNAKLRFTPNPRDGARQLRGVPFQAGYHEIRQGQDMQSIAWAYGRTDWEAIWKDSQNDALREACPEPMVLMPGMRV